MVYTFRTPANTYLQSTANGTLATAEQIDKVVSWVNALEPWETPALQKVMSNDAVDQEVHQWGQSFAIEMESNLDGAIADGVATTFDVASGEGVLFQKYMTLEIYAPLAGTTDTPDMSTYEVVWITDEPSGDTLTVERGYGTTPVAHADGSIVRILGTAEPLNRQHTEAPRQRGVRFFNYPQRFEAQLTADKRHQNMPTWEHSTNSLLADFATEMKKQKILLERSLFRGRRKAGVGNEKASTFGGIDTFLVTNDIDLAGATITPDDLDDILTDIWATTASAEKKVLVMGMNEARILDTSMDDMRRATISDTQSNKTVRAYHFRTGTFEVEPMRNVPPGVIYLLDWSLIKVRPFKGLNWHTTGKDGEAHAVDHDIKAISGDFTVEVQSEHAMARISNFDTDLDNYRTA